MCSKHFENVYCKENYHLLCHWGTTEQLLTISLRLLHSKSLLSCSCNTTNSNIIVTREAQVPEIFYNSFRLHNTTISRINIKPRKKKSHVRYHHIYIASLGHYWIYFSIVHHRNTNNFYSKNKSSNVLHLHLIIWWRRYVSDYNTHWPLETTETICISWYLLQCTYNTTKTVYIIIVCTAFECFRFIRRKTMTATTIFFFFVCKWWTVVERDWNIKINGDTAINLIAEYTFKPFGTEGGVVM